VDLLEGVTKHYRWGSTSAIAGLAGRPATSEPEAELWFGAHSGGPARLERGGVATDLARLVAEEPGAVLGDRVSSEFEGAFPYLLKILAAASPLSLQAHPDLEEARAGFERENQMGIALDDPKRSFRDANHKPELISALTPFVALSGFRTHARTQELLSGLSVKGLAPLLDAVGSEETSSVITSVIDLLSLGEAEGARLANEVAAACAEDLGPPDFRAERREACSIAEAWPGDPGIAVALLLNLVTLEPGEALYLGAGRLHCYLRGTGVELMASSDNVVRGGLTVKHIDVKNLGLLLRPRAGPPDVLSPGAAWHTYDTPVPDFALDRIRLGQPAQTDATSNDTALGGTARWQVTGPEILVGVGGALRLENRVGECLELRPGAGALLVPGDSPVTASTGTSLADGTPAPAESTTTLLFRARVP